MKIVTPDDTIVVTESSFAWDSVASLILSPVIDSGYAFAVISVDESTLVGDTLTIIPEIDSGPVTYVTLLRFSGSFHTRGGLLSRLSGFQPFRFCTSQVASLSERLEQEGCLVLAWEILSPSDAPHQSVGAPDGNSEEAILNFLVEERREPNRFQAAVGYAEDQGFVGSFDLGINNLFGGRRKVSFSWRRLARNNVFYSLYLKDPYIFSLPFGVEAGAGFQSLDSASYHLEASAGVFFNPRGFELGIGYAYEQDRSGVDVARKNLASTRLEAGPLEVKLKAGERKVQRSRAYFGASGRLNVSIPLFRFLRFHLEPNGALVASADSLFTSELVPVGGARSLRGFLEEEFRVPGALWSRQELRWGSEGFYLYPLFDVAWIEDEGLAAGYGAGISITTPIGRLELDAALPWAGSWNRAKLHLSLGADF